MHLPAFFIEAWNSCLLASKEGFGACSVSPLYLDKDQPTTIELAPEDVITGSITNEFGAPVVGAKVGANYFGCEVAYTYSGEHGEFRIGGVDRDRVVHIAVSRSPSDLGMMVIPAENGQPTEVRMPIGCSKTVRVLDAAEMPMAHEKMLIAGHAGRFTWTEMLTDSEGVIVIQGVTPGWLSVYCPGSMREVGEESESVVVMSSVRQIPLEVVDDATGKGLSDVLISKQDKPSECFFLGADRWRSGDAVTFLLGEWNLKFNVEGYEPWCGTVLIDCASRGVQIRMKKKGASRFRVDSDD